MYHIKADIRMYRSADKVLSALTDCLKSKPYSAAALANLKDAKVHWVIEISNVVCQLSVAVATILLLS